ncbi:T9SS type A sorting domain-containing protein [Aquimarina sp. 2201CG5-10]|uniref:T9SS type A sorting domain-containing protein n=1 Tax=Aquimarina callyspongiae TaxID=3098150 RepID=UPI002AB5BB71|nr:T9SS type A sorting domain-containing protein [Aquimarina sp. 2201CG5-10]MDY8136710.1 T9SS type A sorting domain-containing protein [Aquimarina sp. 2201CG5-10]
MKQQLQIILLLLFCHTTFSQDIKEPKINDEIDKMIESLDTSQINSGILLDRSANWSHLDKVNSKNRTEPVNYAYFKQALLDLHIASNKKKFISSTTLKKNLKKENISNDIVYMGIISTSYETINYDKSNSAKSGLTIEDNKFKLIPGRSPFLNNKSLIISPLRIAVKGKTITYKFKKDLWFNNSKKKIVSLVAKFENNKTYEIIRNDQLVINQVKQTYVSTGDKLIYFKASYDDGTTKTIESKVYVIVNKSSNKYSGKISNHSVISDETFNGKKGKMDYRIYYRTNEGSNPNLRKPIIIIDGFDPGDRRRITDSDCANDPDCVDLYNGFFSNEEHVSIWDFNYYKDSNDDTRNLITELRAIGYDVVIVNNPTHQINGQPEIDGGADYIERNGKTLVTLIKWLNTELANNNSGSTISKTNGLVIVGPSMGGQISRYALAYMEKKFSQTNSTEWKHKTRLWISIDSPHLGANIPIGIQAAIHQLAGFGLDGALDFRDRQLGSVAAKQQLIEQYNGRNGNQLDQTKLNARTVSQGYSYSRGSTFFRNFYDNLFNNGLSGSKGYPQNLRKIAITNGSLTNSKQYTSDINAISNGYFSQNGQRTLNIRGFADIPFTTHIFSLETYFKKSTGENGKISRLKLGPSIGNLDQSLYLTNNNSRGNMDNVSGGWYPGQYELNKSTRREGLPIGYMQTRELKPTHSFISTFSALGHLSPDRSWHQALNKNLVCQNLTPFDSYYGESNNTAHTSFNSKSVDWLLEELSGKRQDPYIPLNVNRLIGTSVLCNLDTRNYAFQDVCSVPGIVKEWEVSSNLEVINYGDYNIQVKPFSIVNQAAWVKATFNNGQEIIKPLWIGLPKPPVIDGPTSVAPSALAEYNSLETNNYSAEYQWTYPTGWDYNPNINVNWSWGRPTNTNQDGIIEAKTINSCGCGGVSQIQVEVDNDGEGDPKSTDKISKNKNKDIFSAIKIYPNPVNNILNINIGLKEIDKNTQVILFDNLGRVIKQISSKEESLSMDTSKIPNGIYILKIFIDNHITTKKIVINHQKKIN